MRALFMADVLFSIFLFSVAASLNSETRTLLQSSEGNINVRTEQQLREAVGNLRSGLSIYIDADSIRPTQTLVVLANNVTVRGRGKTQTTLFCPGPKQSLLILMGHNIRISNLTVMGCSNETAVVITDNSQLTGSNDISASFHNVSFTQNGRIDALIDGGAIKINSCQITNCSRPRVDITSCSFDGNAARAGGAVFCHGCDLRIHDSSFTDNEAVYAGGALYLNTGTPILEISGSNFTRNNATNDTKNNQDSDNEAEEFPVISGRGGGAIFIISPTRFLIWTSQFQNNTACISGGAIYINSQNTDRTIATQVSIEFHRCQFLENAIRCTESLGAAQEDAFGSLLESGGALTSIVTDSVLLNAQVNRSTFVNNRAINGGAVMLQGSSSVSHSFSLCSFIRNRANAAAGAILVRGTQLEINGSTFHQNIGRYGGALLIWYDAKLIAGPDLSSNQPTEFESNAALYGGAIEATLRIEIHLDGVIFRNNSSLRHGGGLRIYETTRPIRIRGGVFDSNLAMLGGGISLADVSNFTLESFNGERVQIQNNSAITGGGLFCETGVYLFVMFTIQDADFVKNQAFDLADPAVNETYYSYQQDPVFSDILRVLEERTADSFTAESVYLQLTSLPDGQGGAFALTVGDLTRYVISEITFENLRITENTAKVGGGGALNIYESYWNIETQLRCFPATLGVDSCQKFIFQNVNISDNQAEYAGGLFVSKPGAVLLTCNRSFPGENSTLLDIMKARQQTPNAQFDFQKGLYCTDIHSNIIMEGEGLPGAQVGSSADSLHLENSNGTLETVASGEKLCVAFTGPPSDSNCIPLAVSVKDAFNQTITHGIEDSSLELILSSANIVGELRYTAINGTILIVNTTAWGVNVTHAELVIQSSDGRVTEVRVQFSTRVCVLGESIQDHRCTACLPNQYGFSPTNNSCRSCEHNAICQGRAALVPVNGYWHSTPFSPQFHTCFFPEACTFENRTEKLTHFYKDSNRLQNLLTELEVYLHENGQLPNFTLYEQCADGYEGVLCGSCEPGYGHSLNGECSKCPDNRRVSILLGVVCFLWFFIIIGINAAITLLSSRARIQLVKNRSKNRIKNRNRPVLIRTTSHVNENRVGEITEQIQSISGPSSDMTDAHAQQLLQERLVATVQLTELLKILLNYLQVTSTALRLQVDWKIALTTLLSTEAAFVGIASDALTAPFECHLNGTGVRYPSIAALWLRMLTPTFVLCVLIFTFTVLWIVVRWRSRTETGSLRSTTRSVTGSWRTGIIVIVIVTVYFSFIDVVRELFRTINCIHVDDSRSMDSMDEYESYAVETDGAVWVEDTHLKCFKGAHRGTGISGILGLVLAFIVTASIIIRLPINREHRKDPQFIARYWFLYQGYRMEWYTFGWEAVILTRKAFVAAVIVFAVHMGPNLQATLCVAILLFALMIHSLFRPFIVEQESTNVPDYFGVIFKCTRFTTIGRKLREFINSANLNGLESASLFSSMTVYLSAVILHDPHSSRTGVVLVSALTCLINNIYVLLMFYRLYAGLHLICDLKLELSNPAYMALNPNGPGIKSLIKKGQCIMRVIKEEHLAYFPSEHEFPDDLSEEEDVSEEARKGNTEVEMV
eukprot:g4075.t1